MKLVLSTLVSQTYKSSVSQSLKFQVRICTSISAQLATG